MLRFSCLLSVCAAVVLSAGPSSAQQRYYRGTTPRVSSPKVVEKYPAKAKPTPPQLYNTRPKSTDRRGVVTNRGRTPGKLASQRSSAGPADWGAARPWAASSGAKRLAAAVSNGAGLAVWETSTGRRLLRLENSDRRYSLLAISDDGRWIAGVRRDRPNQIDLWRADNGRHLRVIVAPGGAANKIEFETNDKLLVLTARGSKVVFSVPQGVALGNQNAPARRQMAPKTRQFRLEIPRTVKPSTPATVPERRPSEPPVAVERRPKIVQSAPADTVPLGPKISGKIAPPAASAQPQTMVRERMEMAAPAPAAEAPTAPRREMTFDLTVPQGDEVPPAETREPAPAAPESSQFAAPGVTAEPAISQPLEAAAPEPAAEVPMTPRSAMMRESAAPPEAKAEEEPAAEVAAEPAPEAAAEPGEPQTAAQLEPPADTSGVTSVGVHYATNRNRLTVKDRAWLAYFRGFFGSVPAFVIYGLMVLSLVIFPWFGKRAWGAAAVMTGLVLLCAMGSFEAWVRSQLRDEMSGEMYGCRPSDLSYGMCEISVPPSRNRHPGELNRPLSVWVFQAPENPEKHFMLRRVEEYKDKDAFYARLSAKLAKSDTGAALLFIHGYNVSFEDAIFRTAQLAVDLKFPGAPIAYCWPSYADAVKYPFDEQNAEVSIPALRELLMDLAARSGAKRIHIIAHSMGNRVLAGALEGMDRAAQAQNKKVFRELVLAAPDVDRRVFESQVLPHIVQNAQHCTLYASSRDRALMMSRAFHNYQRLGETEPDLLVTKGMDTIDASLVDTSLLGHSYIGDVQSIVSDLHDLVVAGKRPAQRAGLQLLTRNALTYWSIEPGVQTAINPAVSR